MYKDVLILIQARMGSTRLPGKVLLPFGSSTVIGYLLDRLVNAKFSRKQICVATSVDKNNVELINYLDNNCYNYFAGSESNVLSRYQLASKNFNKNIIVRLTADNPFINTSLVKCCIDSHIKSGARVTSTRMIDLDGKITKFLPKGSSVDIFQKDTLLEIDDDECNEFDREHVIPALFRKNKVNLINKTKLKYYGINLEDIIGLSIDTKSDYNKACKIVNSYE
jgi:spore coat polysaccharide biosynthesis protein SpsF